MGTGDKKCKSRSERKFVNPKKLSSAPSNKKIQSIVPVASRSLRKIRFAAPENWPEIFATCPVANLAKIKAEDIAEPMQLTEALSQNPRKDLLYWPKFKLTGWNLVFWECGGLIQFGKRLHICCSGTLWDFHQVYRSDKDTVIPLMCFFQNFREMLPAWSVLWTPANCIKALCVCVCVYQSMSASLRGTHAPESFHMKTVDLHWISADISESACKFNLQSTAKWIGTDGKILKAKKIMRPSSVPSMTLRNPTAVHLFSPRAAFSLLCRYVLKLSDQVLSWKCQKDSLDLFWVLFHERTSQYSGSILTDSAQIVDKKLTMLWTLLWDAKGQTYILPFRAKITRKKRWKSQVGMSSQYPVLPIIPQVSISLHNPSSSQIPQDVTRDDEKYWKTSRSPLLKQIVQFS